MVGQIYLHDLHGLISGLAVVVLKSRQSRRNVISAAVCVRLVSE